MANNQIRPLARLFRGMADLIDQDHSSQTRYRGYRQGGRGRGGPRHRPGAGGWAAVAGRRGGPAGVGLAFHAGLPRQAITAAHVQAMQQPTPAPGPAGAQRRAPVVDPTWLGRPPVGDPDD